MLDDIRSILHATPATLHAIFGGLSDELARATYGPDTFSPFDVLGHLILGERLDWIPRARIILAHGEERPFDPFPWDGCDRETEQLSVSERLDVFASLRAESLAALDAMRIDEDDMARTGAHPMFGPVTLRQLLTVWAVHDTHHVAQICKAVNYQFRDRIGPWRPFINSIPEPVT